MAFRSTGTASQALTTGSVYGVLRCETFTAVGAQVTYLNNSSLAGAITVQASDDDGVSTTNAYDGAGVTNWFTLAAPASVAINTGTGNMIDIPFPFNHRWIRFVVTQSSGSASVVIRMTGKGDVSGTG